ncbi:MAG: signal peptidase I [Actinomycetota bacterium]
MRSLVVCTILVFCCLAISCKGFAFRVPTENMLPTIKVGDTCIVDQYSKIEIQRFDIVMFKAPEAAKKMTRETGDVKYISRIIGLPNEKIEIIDSKVFINDKLLDESFEKLTDDRDRRKNVPALVIPENEYFVMGDNRPQSLDSRYWKPETIKKEEILVRRKRFWEKS